MEFTKYGHSCISVEKDGQRVIVDPGAFSHEPDLGGFDAVLITHEHADHFVEEKIRAAAAAHPELQIWCNAAVAGRLDGIGQQVHSVGQDDEFEAAGYTVRVFGQWHAVIHPDIPRITNVGFLIDGQLFHPGDALTVPGQPIETLLLPAHAPWSRTAELIDWVREVAPARTIAIHDGALNEIGLALVAGLLGPNGPGIGTEYQRLTPPATLQVA
jgi:L-ascorbate metabolism protein UlaG (beta-lactamase superfamily)